MPVIRVTDDDPEGVLVDDDTESPESPDPTTPEQKKSEKRLQQQIMKKLGMRHDMRVFRNNVGKFLTSYGTRIQTGLCVGSADLIGIKKVRITSDMVGTDIGVFVSIEVKSENGRLRPEQKLWYEMVEYMGGIAKVINHLDELDNFS